MNIKTSSSTAIAAAALFAFFSIAVPCAARESDPARDAFGQGIQFVRQEEYLKALAAFIESYRLKPTEAALFNTAMCFKALFRYVEAIDAFEHYLVHNSAKPEKKKKADAAMAEMEKLIGRARLTGAPGDAEVRVDGKVVDAARLKDPIRLDPGEHDLVIFKEGFEKLSLKIEVRSDSETEIDATLKPKPPRLHVACDEPKALVTVDGKNIGGCPYKGEVAPGPHEVAVEAAGKKRFTTRIDARPGLSIELPVSMENKSDEPARRLSPTGFERGTAPDSTPLEQSGSELSSVFLVGAVLGAVGLGAVGLGSYFAYQYGEDFDEGEAAADSYNGKDYRTLDDPDVNTYNNSKDSLIADRVGIIVSFTAAGLLLAAGITMMVLGADDGEENGVAMTANPNGLAVQF